MESLWSPYPSTYGVDCYNLHAPAQIFQPREGLLGFSGVWGRAPSSAHGIAHQRPPLQISARKFAGTREKMYLCTENPTARPNGQECHSPERILRKAAHVTAYDQPRRGFLCLHTHTRAHALDKFQLTAAV